MSILFKPTGELNIATSPSDLREEGGGTQSVSYAMTRCKNLSLVADGKATTRHGSTNLHNLGGYIPSFIIEQDGSVYSFASGSIFREASSIASSLNGSQWSAIKYNQYNDSDNQIFALNGSDRKRINGEDVYEWGIEPPDTAPTITTGASTGLTGSYNVKYTYCRKVGSTVVSESNPSDEATADQSLTNQSLSVTWTASTDSQVTHVRIYRTLATGTSNYFHDQDVAIGTTTLDTNTADASLGSAVATDHDRPPTGSVVLGPVYNGVCFILKDNLLYWCKSKQPEYWPALNFVEIGPKQFPGTAMAFVDGNLFVMTAERIWQVQGTIAGTFNPVPLDTSTGAPDLFGAIGIKGLGLYHVGEDGLYVFTGGRDRKMTQGNFEPIFRGNTTNGMAAVVPSNRWLHAFENKLYFHWNGNMLVFNVDNGKWEYRVYDQSFTCPATDYANKRMLVGTTDGMVRILEDASATTDAGTSYAWECQSKDFTLQTRAHFPRFIKYDVEGTATGYLLLDDVIHQTHSLSDDRATRYRLVKTGNGNRCAIRIAGNTSNGAATVYAVESE